MASSFCDAFLVCAVAVPGGSPSAYSPRPRDNAAMQRRAEEVDFTARNFATITRAAQGPPRGRGGLNPMPTSCRPIGRFVVVEIMRALLLCYGLAEFLSQLETRMLRNLKSLLAALALLLIPAIAHAEEPTKPYPDCGREPTDAEVQAAKGAFQAGNASFNEADYTRAIDYWEDAYRRDCTANPLLLNLARAYELAGRKRQAVVSLETFLTREPSSGEKEQINRRVEVLKKKIAEEDAAAAATPPPTTGATTPPVAGPATPPPPATAQSKRSPWPWVVIGVGGVAVVVRHPRLPQQDAAGERRRQAVRQPEDPGRRRSRQLLRPGPHHRDQR